MSLIIDMVAIANNLGRMEQIVLFDKIALADMELRAIDPDSKSAVDKQVMIFAQKSATYTDLKALADGRMATLGSFQRMYSLYNTICSRIDFNIENSSNFAEFEAQVKHTATNISNNPF